MECKFLLFRATVYLLSFLVIPVVFSSRECNNLKETVCSEVCCCKYFSDVSVREIVADCAHQNLAGVPVDLPVNTVELDLSFGNISSLPADAFSHLPNLLHLKLIGNHLASLEKNVFRGLIKLHTLNLQMNWFQRIPSLAFHKDLAKLERLHMEINYLSNIPDDAFINLSSLVHLSLKNNMLTSIPTRALRHLQKLKGLLLSHNKITAIPDHAFENNVKLTEILLENNNITDIQNGALINLSSLRDIFLEYNQLLHIPVEALRQAQALEVLGLGYNSITSVPDHAFVNNTMLTKLELSNNDIKYISSHAFAGLPHLEVLSFKFNDIENIGHIAFRNLPSLKYLEISDVINLSIFPDLTGTNKLEDLGIDRCSIRTIPENFCNNKTSLKHLNLHNNQIETWPNLSKCSELRAINLGTNKLTSLEGQPFFGLTELNIIILDLNDITHIPADAFDGLHELHELSLNDNDIADIDSEAFASCVNLEFLFLDSNSFPVMPFAGLQNLVRIVTGHNDRLVEFPSPTELPNIYQIETSYAYHCCEYIALVEEYKDSFIQPNISEKTNWYSSESETFFHDDSNMTNDVFGAYSDFVFLNWMNGTPSWLVGSPGPYTPLPHNVSCIPKPGPFVPCLDLFGSWPLRIGVWLVFLLAIIGNFIVIFVILVSHTKMDVPRFLICNLAFADFFLGVYLGFLAKVDASTLGVFRIYGAYWQMSSGCKIAGYLAVFSSELSIYTLSVITLERFYAIKHALHLEKRMKLPHAITVMCFGWLFSVICAVLPLVNVSHYHKYPVCLPFDIETTIAKVYVGTVLILNILAFIVILLCYASIYSAIQGSHAWNCNDSRVARRMSLLVFTDFACWAPIAFFSLTSAFGLHLISLNGAKVLTIFVLPLNSCANPFLYTILTKQFKKDCKMILRSLSNRVFRQRSMSRSITLSLGRHPSTRSTQAHQSSQLRWRTNGSISQDVTGDPCLVSFKTENGEPSSNIYTVSNFNSTEPQVEETTNLKSSCSCDHSQSDSTTMLDPMTHSATLDDPRRGSRSPLLDLINHAKSKTPDVKLKSKTRRKFSIPIPFFSSRSPSKSAPEGSLQHSSARNSPLGQHHKRSHSVTEGLLHKMGRKKPLTLMKSAPGIPTAVSRSTEQLPQVGNGNIDTVHIIIPQNENPGHDTTLRAAKEEEMQYEAKTIQDPWQSASLLFKTSMTEDMTEDKCLLEIERSADDPGSSMGGSSVADNAERLLRSTHDNPIQDQLSSATPSPLLPRPQDLNLEATPTPTNDNPGCDSGLGTASSPFPDSNESMKFLPDSPPELNSLEGVRISKTDSPKTKSQASGLGNLFAHLTRPDQSKSYDEVPNSPTKGKINIITPRESIV